MLFIYVDIIRLFRHIYKNLKYKEKLLRAPVEKYLYLGTTTLELRSVIAAPFHPEPAALVRLTSRDGGNAKGLLGTIPALYIG